MIISWEPQPYLNDTIVYVQSYFIYLTGDSSHSGWVKGVSDGGRKAVTGEGRPGWVMGDQDG